MMHYSVDLKEARPVWRPWLARHVQKSETSIYWSYFEPDNNPDTYSTCQTKFAHGLMISFSGGACWYGYSVLAQEGPAASDNLFYPAPEPWKRSTYPPERSREPFMLCHQPDFTLHSYLSPSKIVQNFFKIFSKNFEKNLKKILNDFWRSTNTGVEYIHVDANT